LQIPKEYNAKGVGLFVKSYCNIYKAQKISKLEEFGRQKDIFEKINCLANLLISLQSKGYSGACWGYNFDWQNRVFYLPKFTPTVVATSFCADALFKAYYLTKNNLYLETALSSCEFVCNDLNRTINNYNELIFSYSPLDSSKVYNASLLGARLLSKGYSYTQNKLWKSLSQCAAQTIVKKQSIDGSWIYGENKVQYWIDSFHTGYILECLWEIMKNTNDKSYNHSLNNGLSYYLSNFFLSDGTPKYYNNNTYPIDIHCPAQLIVTLSRTKKFNENKALVDSVLNWTITNMQSEYGYFYYQIKRGISSKIPYMRWAQAWMFYTFSEYFSSAANEDLD